LSEIPASHAEFLFQTHGPVVLGARDKLATFDAVLQMSRDPVFAEPGFEEIGHGVFQVVAEAALLHGVPEEEVAELEFVGERLAGKC
jgi:hypothetical protein